MSIWILALLASPAVAQTPAQTTLLTANRTVPIQAGVCSVETRAMFLGARPDRPDCPDILLWSFVLSDTAQTAQKYVDAKQVELSKISCISFTLL